MNNDQIQNEIKAYEGMRAELEKHHNGKHVIIKNGRLEGAFDTFDAAARDAIRRFGSDTFLIRQVGAPETMRVPASVAWRPIHAAS
jgi:hypothetical protein